MWKSANNPDLFGEPANGPVSLHIPDGELTFYPRFLPEEQAVAAMATLLRETPWAQEHIQLYGKRYLSPRLTAWYGDPGREYSYSGISHSPLPWTLTLAGIRQRLQQIADTPFNSVLLNLYRSGADSVAWHADDEPELGRNPVIASVSLGAPRTFQLKHKTRPSEKRALVLESGSCLLMHGKTQRHWLHRLAKCPAITEPRINLTLRLIK